MMTRKNPYADVVDSLINELPENQLHNSKEKEHPLTAHSQIREDLWNEILNAVSEKDIITLRQKLQEISTGAEPTKSDQESVFDLTEMLDIPGFLDQCPVCSPDLMSITEPLPKIHVHNHRRATGETFHHFYMEQHNAVLDETDFEGTSEADEEWKLITEAVMEKDIMELRESLKQISSFNSLPVYSTVDIEKYLEGQMPDEEKLNFEDELLVNSELRADIRLNKELKEAVSEKDIISLRNSLESIIRRQNSTSKSLREIEAYLDNELPDSERTSFVEELTDNDDLKAEVRLVEELSSTFSEKDILKLRENLKKISIEINQQEKKSFLPSHDFKKNIRKVGTIAAIFFFLTGLSFFLQYSGHSENEVFVKYFKTPQAISTFRSTEKSANMDLGNAFKFYNQSDYQTALIYFQKVLEKEAALQVAHFYSGASYQGLKSYERAILEYNNVIQDNNNMFVEQAEWYRALCNFGLGNKKTAITQLEAINNKNGYFEKDAKSLLKQLKIK